MATKRTPHLWCAETCWRFANVWRKCFVHVQLFIKIKLITVHRTTTYPVFWRQGVQLSTNSPETKTQFIDVALSVRKNVEAVHCVRWLPYTSFWTDNPELIILPFGTCNLCERRRCAGDNNNNKKINKIYFTDEITLHVEQTVNTEKLQHSVS